MSFLKVCPICGKKLKNPNSPSHVKSEFHQKALKQMEQNIKRFNHIKEIKKNLEDLEMRMKNLEKENDNTALTV